MVRRGLRGLIAMLSIAAGVILLMSAVPRAQQAPLPSARDVIDRFLQAAGGADAFKAVQSMRGRGTISIPSQNMSGDVEMMAARPNKMITHANISGVGRLEEAFDGKVAWSIDPVSGPALITGRALTERADESWFDAPLHGPDYVREMTVVGREEFDKRPAYKLKVVLVSGTEQFEFFDVETGLQIGLEATREGPFGSAPTTAISRDYRTFGALKLPATQVLRMLGIEQVVTFASYEFDVVPANTFDLPPVIKALIK